MQHINLHVGVHIHHKSTNVSLNCHVGAQQRTSYYTDLQDYKVYHMKYMLLVTVELNIQLLLY